MFTVVALPMADVRPFLPNGGGRRPKPPFPPTGGEHFLPEIGGYCYRARGGSDHLAGEDIYCDASQTIRFASGLGTKPIGEGTVQVRPHVALRRLFFDGQATVRLEVGLRRNRRSPPLQNASGTDALAFARALLEQRVAVRFDGSVHETTLRRAADLAASKYRIATAANGDLTPRGVLGTAPIVLMEFKQGELGQLPPQMREVANAGGIDLRFAWLQWKDHRRVGTWILSSKPGADHCYVRQLRMHLLRLHASREVLKVVLQQVASGDVSPSGGDELARFEQYLDRSYDLCSPKRFGLDQKDLLDAVTDYLDHAEQGARATINAALETARKSVRWKTLKVMGQLFPSGASATILNVEGDYVVGDQQNVNLSNINTGGGDLLIGQKQQIIDSFKKNVGDKVKGLPDDAAALKAEIDKLSTLVADLVKQAPIEVAEEAGKNFSRLVDEATAKKPNRKWWDVSAEGLLEAAKAVVGLAAPVGAAVKAIAGILTFA